MTNIQKIINAKHSLNAMSSTGTSVSKLPPVVATTLRAGDRCQEWEFIRVYADGQMVGAFKNLETGKYMGVDEDLKVGLQVTELERLTLWQIGSTEGEHKRMILTVNETSLYAKLENSETGTAVTLTDNADDQAAHWALVSAE